MAKANNKLTAVKQFKRWLVHQQFACLRECFDDFNRDGGAIIRVNGKPIHFARATILALYGDHPACVKSTITGSACPYCFEPQSSFGNREIGRAPPRTSAAMRAKKEDYLQRILDRRRGDVTAARREAIKEGVNLDVNNGWQSPPDVPNCFGPDDNFDNVWLNSPSLNLHALDEGLIEKFDAGTVRWAIHDAAQQHGMSVTEVTRVIDSAFAATYNERPLNSNVEVNGRDAFQLFPHGVVGYLLDSRRLNAKWYGPLSDQLQFFLGNSNLLTTEHKKQMHDLAHMVRQIHYMVRQPVRKDGGVEEYQAYLDSFITRLVNYNFFSHTERMPVH